MRDSRREGAMQKLLLTLAMSLALVAFSSVISAQGKKTAPKAKVTKQVKKAGAATKSEKTANANPGKKQRAVAVTSGKKGKKSSKSKAKAAGPSKATGEPSGDLEKTVENLSSKDPEIVLESILLLGASGKQEYAAPLLALLQKGPRSDITDATLFALGDLHSTDSVDTLMEYLGHRRSDARLAALFAVKGFKAEKVTRAIEQCLRDSDRQVRGTAALALGERGDRVSVPILFKAFERGVFEAAVSIGQLGKPEDAKRLTSHLGKADIKVLLSGFEEFLNRKDFPEDAKLSILNRLFDLAGPEVWRFAVTYKATFSPDTDENENKLYKLVSRMVRQIKDK